MNKSRSRLVTAIVLAGLTPATFAIHSVVSPGTAQARCRNGAPTVSTLEVGATRYVTDTPVSGTCDGNRTYTTWLTSNQKGRSAYILYRYARGESWIASSPPAGTGGVKIEIQDFVGVGYPSVEMALCSAATGSVICGWGRNYVSRWLTPNDSNSFWGVNEGF
jgi:hypothetical protein